MFISLDVILDCLTLLPAMVLYHFLSILFSMLLLIPTIVFSLIYMVQLRKDNLGPSV